MFYILSEKIVTAIRGVETLTSKLYLVEGAHVVSPRVKKSDFSDSLTSLCALSNITKR